MEAGSSSAILYPPKIRKDLIRRELYFFQVSRLLYRSYRSTLRTSLVPPQNLAYVESDTRKCLVRSGSDTQLDRIPRREQWAELTARMEMLHDFISELRD